jgi:hypothetical protein
MNTRTPRASSGLHVSRYQHAPSRSTGWQLYLGKRREEKAFAVVGQHRVERDSGSGSPDRWLELAFYPPPFRRRKLGPRHNHVFAPHLHLARVAAILNVIIGPGHLEFGVGYSRMPAPSCHRRRCWQRRVLARMGDAKG